jgi:hypothetical protein
MFFDPESEQMVLIGGYSCAMLWNFEHMHYQDLWAFDFEMKGWDGLGEIDLNRVSNIGYDAESERVIMLTNSPIQTWAFHPASKDLVNMDPEIMPPDTVWSGHLFGAEMAYDAESDRLILFGGGERPGLTHADTWAYDHNSNTWELMQPPVSPPPRAFHELVYDSESDRIILWGGYPNPENDVDIWAYDYNADAWERLENIDGPQTHSQRFGMIYHPPSDRVVLYSGFLEEIEGRQEQMLPPETWSYDYNNNRWEEIHTEENPGARMWYTFNYDPVADMILLFGGETTAKYAVQLTNAVWLFDFSTMQWRDATIEHASCPE